jgi:hypothetical protein
MAGLQKATTGWTRKENVSTTIPQIKFHGQVAIA